MSAKGLRVGHFRLYVRFKASVRRSLYFKHIVSHNESRTYYCVRRRRTLPNFVGLL